MRQNHFFYLSNGGEIVSRADRRLLQRWPGLLGQVFGFLKCEPLLVAVIHGAAARPYKAGGERRGG